MTRSATTQPQARAVHRRAALLDAAAALLAEGGSAAVSHRAVAQRAALPLAATTYYFASRDELIAEAFGRLVDHELAFMRETGLDDLMDGLAGRDRAQQLGLWELYLHAGREPGVLRTHARRWSEGCQAVVADLLGVPVHDPRAQLLYSAMCGVWLAYIVDGRPLDEVRQLLRLATEAATRPS
ncbi:TetR/AcrR family transcriptional regulator [Nonomuraea longicatena]|uniref:HTH tetR-type domain-containing protein n=1 Tax=Nonomuraea longicatena TaxID=83682 RepID=A0ABN1NXJ8_9ACTN